MTDVHLSAVKLAESGGQQLPALKKNLAGNSFNQGKIFFVYWKY